jgi:hypothetical protein
MSQYARCYSCGTELDLKVGDRAARSDSCPSCRRDVRCCYNCRFYDSTSYNECGEPQADRVVDKDKSNFCDYFALSGRGAGSGSGTAKDDIRKQLDDLFK